MNYKKVTAVAMSVVIMASAAGCGAQKTLQEQVTENLLKEEQTQGYRPQVAPSLSEELLQSEIEDAAKEAAEVSEAAEPAEAEEEPASEAESEESVSEAEPEVPDETKVQIVFLGDSIFDASRDGTGIPSLVGDACNANIYNLAIGGTTAALLADDDARLEKWDSSCMLGVIHAILGEVSPDCFAQYHAREIFDKCDFSKTDYFVVEYGTNDFFSKIPIHRDEVKTGDSYCYYGAVAFGVSMLKSTFPDAEVIFVTPHYEQFWGKNNTWLGDCNTVDLGYGTLSQYIAAGYDAARIAGAVPINAYNDMGIDGYTAEDDLEDGVHLTEAGRRKYAEVLARRINKMEINKAN